jgi:hypothetical protein
MTLALPWGTCDNAVFVSLTISRDRALKVRSWRSFTRRAPMVFSSSSNSRQGLVLLGRDPQLAERLCWQDG